MPDARSWTFGAPSRAPSRLGLARLVALALVGCCLLGGAGCATRTISEQAGFYHHRELGYRIARPDTDAAWQPIRVEGADLAFRQKAPEPAYRPAMMILMSECGRGAENLAIVARQLVIGIPERALRQSAPMALSGSQGWTQIFDTFHEGVAVRVKTVSIRNDGCTFDWALVAPGPFRAAEEQFDTWWSSFERLPDPAREPSELSGRSRESVLATAMAANLASRRVAP